MEEFFMQNPTHAVIIIIVVLIFVGWALYLMTKY